MNLISQEIEHINFWLFEPSFIGFFNAIKSPPGIPSFSYQSLKLQTHLYPISPDFGHVCIWVTHVPELVNLMDVLTLNMENEWK